jgi:hypothetical protein
VKTQVQLAEEEDQSIERERAAFERRQEAFFAVNRQFQSIGDGVVSNDSIAEWDAAEKEWWEAVAVMDAIAADIQSGRRP